MALTNVVQGRNATRFTVGDKNAVLVQVTFDSSYPEGGEAFDVSQFGIQDPTKAKVFPSVRAESCPGNTMPVVGYDRTNKKLKAFGKGTSVAYIELCACDLSTLVVDVLIVEND